MKTVRRRGKGAAAQRNSAIVETRKLLHDALLVVRGIPNNEELKRRLLDALGQRRIIVDGLAALTPKEREEITEQMGLSLYDILNPDQRTEIRVPKDECLRLAANALAYLEEQDAKEFDAKIERDAESGKLDRLADEALRTRRVGRPPGAAQ